MTQSKISISVQLCSFFRDSRFEHKELVFNNNCIIQDVVDELKLAKDNLIVVRNTFHASLGDTLNDGDQLTLLPMIDGG